MFVTIRNLPRDYAWGARRAVSALLGTSGACLPTPDEAPQAELWLGSHSGAPSEVVTGDGQAPGAGATLDRWIADDPRRALDAFADGLHAGAEGRLPFLLKVLAADGALSLQTHPRLDTAAAGYAAEEAAGIPRDAPHRNYRDPLHKPELLLAVTDRFRALAGFRDPSASAAEVRGLTRSNVSAADSVELLRFAEALDALTEAPGASQGEGFAKLVAALLAGERAGLVRAVTHACQSDAAVDGGAVPQFVATVRELLGQYPGDPGVVIAGLLHRIELRRGEAIFLEAGTLHAYLEGVGIELMAASDNVLRGGLTSKHIDVPELLRTLDASVIPEPRVTPSIPAPGVAVFAPPVPDFALTTVSPAELAQGVPARLPLRGPGIALATTADWQLEGAESRHLLRRGEAVYITPDEAELLVAPVPGTEREDAGIGAYAGGGLVLATLGESAVPRR